MIMHDNRGDHDNCGDKKHDHEYEGVLFDNDNNVDNEEDGDIDADLMMMIMMMVMMMIKIMMMMMTIFFVGGVVGRCQTSEADCSLRCSASCNLGEKVFIWCPPHLSA